MRFATFAVAAFAAFTSVHAVDLTPNGVVKSIEEITDLSSDANDVISSVNGPFDVFKAVPKLITGLKDIVTTATSKVTMLSDAGDVKFPEGGQRDVCDAFTGFVKVHQALLKTIIGKKGLLAGTPFTAPVAAALRAIEGVVDKLAFGIIGLVPSCAESAKKDADALKGTIGDAIKEYSPKLPFRA